jgi:hypothetical protein
MRGRGRAALAAIATGTAVASCLLITGGTGGYGLAPPDAGICAFDVASLGITDLSCACASSADCDGEPYCCFAVNTSSLSAGSSCRSTPCDASIGAQLCKTTSECLGASCVAQVCGFGTAVSIPVQACGSLDGCAP